MLDPTSVEAAGRPLTAGRRRGLGILGAMLRRVLLMLFTVLVGAAACRSSAPSAVAPPVAGPVESEITAERIAAHVRMLSHDGFEGRAPASRGGELAATYLAEQLALLGVEPAGDNGTYFQQVPIVEAIVDRSFTLTVPGRTYRYGGDVVAFSGVEDPKVSVRGDVVFVGHGIVAPEQRWNDYAGVDVKGKWVLVMVNDPPAPADEPTLFGGPALTYYGRWTYKFEEAARQGAAGALLIHTDESATYPWQVVQSSWTGTQYALPPAEGAPALRVKAWIANAAATDLAKRGGHDLDALRAAASKRGFAPVPLKVSATAQLTQTSARKTAPNVVGVVKGTNPREAVAITAHWDHFGVRALQPGESPDVDRIYNGAYDNASGCAAVLTMAQAITRAGTPPGRSIYIVFTTAEESGLLGAEYFATHPPLPMAAFAANLNIDGANYLGRTKDIVMLGSDRSTLGTMFSDLAKSRARVVGEDAHPERGYFFRSDHFPLAKAGVPALSLSEPKQFEGPNAAALLAKQEAYNGKDYHQPSDEYDAPWDFSGAAADMQLLTALAWQVAAAPSMPTYHDGDQFAQVRKR
jgi:Zn-dependent M28 family amino/carboxypeptidase